VARAAAAESRRGGRRRTVSTGTSVGLGGRGLDHDAQGVVGVGAPVSGALATRVVPRAPAARRRVGSPRPASAPRPRCSRRSRPRGRGPGSGAPVAFVPRPGPTAPLLHTGVCSRTEGRGRVLSRLRLAPRRNQPQGRSQVQHPLAPPRLDIDESGPEHGHQPQPRDGGREGSTLARTDCRLPSSRSSWPWRSTSGRARPGPGTAHQSVAGRWSGPGSRSGPSRQPGGRRLAATGETAPDLDRFALQLDRPTPVVLRRRLTRAICSCPAAGTARARERNSGTRRRKDMGRIRGSTRQDIAVPAPGSPLLTSHPHFSPAVPAIHQEPYFPSGIRAQIVRYFDR